jgi:hypothetical protein
VFRTDRRLPGTWPAERPPAVMNPLRSTKLLGSPLVFHWKYCQHARLSFAANPVWGQCDTQSKDEATRASMQ